jgi:hypothetical protein
MTINLQNDVTILNIFKNELEFAKGFIDHHKDLVKQIVMLNTGNYEVFEQIKQYASAYENILVNFRHFESVDFSKFRNALLDTASVSTPFILWMDTDEILLTTSNEIDFDDRCDVGGIIRDDGSKLFSTELDRLYRTSLPGLWVNPIHEHFKTEYIHSKDEVTQLRILHLTSESQRDDQKKVQYFEILVEQYQKANLENDRQGKINALQHIILMASHDFRNPQMCIDFFEANKDLIFSMNTDYEISKVQKLNILLHALISYSRVGSQDGVELIDPILKIDSSKSTYFQVLRGLAFNNNLSDFIKSRYLGIYQLITIDTNGEFNNLDFQKEKEIAWLERKIGIRQ